VDEPEMPPLADASARLERLGELFAEHGMTVDRGDRVQAHMLNDSNRVIQHFADICSHDTMSWRFAACIFRTWAETFDGLADYGDERNTYKMLRALGGAETIENYLRSYPREGADDDDGDERTD
jgi:hypothetical protein